MKKQIYLSSLLVMLTGITNAEITPVSLKCENLNNPMVVDIPEPRLSWINSDESHTRGQSQSAYEIRVANSLDLLLAGKADLWNSGRVMSDASVNIQYEGKPLRSRLDC